MSDDSPSVVKFLKKIGPYAIMITIGGASAGLSYALHRVGDLSDGYTEIKKEQTQMIKALYDAKTEILIAIKDKEMACEVLEASVTNGKYTHNYCKK